MAKEDHLAILNLGTEAWNKWRSDNPQEEINFSGVRFGPRDLSHADLSNVFLEGADLSRAFLNDVNLSGAMLFKADLSDAWLQNANLSKAVLNEATLFRTNLIGANLGEAELQGATLVYDKPRESEYFKLLHLRYLCMGR